MFPLKNNKENIQLATLLIPIAMSWASAKIFPVLFCILSAVMLLLLVNLMPLFKNNETKWTFLVTFLLVIPINIKLIEALLYINCFIFFDFLMLKIVGCTLIYIILLCLEETIMCVLSAGLANLRNKILH